MQVVAILVCYYQQGSEGFGVLDLHLGRSMEHGQPTDTGHKSAPEHTHAQQGGYLDGCHHASQAHVDPYACMRITFLVYAFFSSKFP